MKLSTQTTIMNNLAVKQNVVNSIIFVCHIFIGVCIISCLSCYNGFLNISFETKVRQNDAKKNISIINIKLVNMNPIKTAKTSIIDYTRYYTLDDQIKI